MFFDSHVHYNLKADDPINDLRKYVLENRVNDLVLILNTREDYSQYKQMLRTKDDLIDRIRPVLGLNVSDCFYKEAIEMLENEKINYGLKIHPRLYRINKKDKDLYYTALETSGSNLVVIDDFLYGNDYDRNIGIEMICELASLYQEKTIVMAHSGGVDLLEHVMRSKKYHNIFYELSLTINYLIDSSLSKDIYWLIKYMHSRVVVGSDYPDFMIVDAYSNIRNIVTENGLPYEYIEEMMDINYRKIYGKLGSNCHE